jgi:siroheme synthase
MGVASIADIRQQLSDANVAPDLPVAIVENGTTRQQRTILSSAAAMEDDAMHADIVSPAIVFVGESIRAAEHLQWFDGQSVDSDVVLDGLHTSHIDYLQLIETG